MKFSVNGKICPKADEIRAEARELLEPLKYSLLATKRTKSFVVYKKISRNPYEYKGFEFSW